MSRAKKIATSLLAMLAWGLSGTFLGAAVGYVVYVKKPAEFESSATVEIARSDGPKSDQQDSKQSGDVDDSHLIMSMPVLKKAVSMGRLEKSFELRGPNDARRESDELVEFIQTSGKLRVEHHGPTVTGNTYRVMYRGATPRSSQHVLQAVLDACGKHLAEVDNRDDWQESMELLTAARSEIDARNRELEQQVKSLGLSEEIGAVDGALLSASGERYQRIRSETYALQQLRTALANKIRQVEALIQEGAPSSKILDCLDVPVLPHLPDAAIAGTEGMTPEEIRATERQQVLAERIRLEREIERQVAPLQEELDKMLERLGSQHPTVRFKQGQITKLRAPLKDLPPLSSLLGDNLDSADASAAEGEISVSEQSEDPGAARKILTSLKAVRSEKQSVDSRFATLTEQLDEMATEVARQENLQTEKMRLQTQMKQQQELGEQLTKRLQDLSATAPFPAARLTLLQPATTGAQVAPQLLPHLIQGACYGLLAGIVLVALLLLTSMATSE